MTDHPDPDPPRGGAIVWAFACGAALLVATAWWLYRGGGL